MEEVEGFLGGELDYKHLKGGTGPLVYPAGFVYLFSGIRWVTNGSVFPAQVSCHLSMFRLSHVVMLRNVSTQAQGAAVIGCGLRAPPSILAVTALRFIG